MQADPVRSQTGSASPIPGVATVRDLDTRRRILNAIIFRRPLDTLGLPAHVVSWHLIWLWHARRIDFDDDGTPVELHPRHAAA